MARVLVVDDSPLFVRLLTHTIETDRRHTVVGSAADGRQAVSMVRELRPDVVTMDVLMPVMDGLDAVEQIMAVAPTPILVLSSDPRGASGELAFEALRRGALDLLPKPAGWPPTTEEWQVLGNRIAMLAGVPVIHHLEGRRRARRHAAQHASAPSRVIVQGGPRRPEVVALAASTGGPQALAQVIGGLPRSFAAGVLVVQHLAPGFVGGLASWLQRVSVLEVRVAEDGDEVRPATALLAPDGAHLVLVGGRVRLDRGAPVEGHRPSATVLMRSVAAACGGAAAGVILSGMGRDGVEGLLELQRAGGVTMAQDEESSVVFGMPREALLAGAAARQVPLDAIAGILAAAVGTTALHGAPRKGRT